MLLKSAHQNMAPHNRTQSYLGAVTAANGLQVVKNISLAWPLQIMIWWQNWHTQIPA